MYFFTSGEHSGGICIDGAHPANHHSRALLPKVPTVKDIMYDWMKWEPIMLPTQSKVVNINQYRLPGNYDEVTEIIKELKEVEVICSA